jgi:hypothetical protein
VTSRWTSTALGGIATAARFRPREGRLRGGVSRGRIAAAITMAWFRRSRRHRCSPLLVLLRRCEPGRSARTTGTRWKWMGQSRWRAPRASSTISRSSPCAKLTAAALRAPKTWPFPTGIGHRVFGDLVLIVGGLFVLRRLTPRRT